MWEQYEESLNDFDMLAGELIVHLRAILKGEWEGEAVDLEASLSRVIELGETIAESASDVLVNLSSITGE